jgi:hypothetical protein
VTPVAPDTAPDDVVETPIDIESIESVETVEDTTTDDFSDFGDLHDVPAEPETVEVIEALNEDVTPEAPDTAPDDVVETPTDTEIKEIPSLESTQEWLGEINPNFDPYDWDSPYNNNCGSCSFAVSQRLDGDTEIVATAANIGTIEEMNELTGMEQVAMNPDEIQEYLIAQGAGSHGIVGIDRAEGPGHWFNAYYDGEKVVAIDGQSGEIRDWPPDYGNVTNWDLSVRKEKS